MRSTKDLFAAHRLRCTRQRSEVYERLRGLRTHPTAEELHREICGCDCGCQTSLATVYNSLEALCRAGLVRKIPTSSGARYDADLSDHLHVSMPDGRLVDVPTELSSALLSRLPGGALDEISAKLGVRIDRIAVQLVASVEGGTGGDGVDRAG